MKRLLIIAVIAVLVITGSIFAFTFTTATTTIGVTPATSDFAAVNSTVPTAPDVFGKFTGTWPDSTLYDITPHADYNGDLVITVYLVNAGELIRYYQHLNMTLEFQDTDGDISDEQAEAQVLNLQNGQVSFTWANGTGDTPYKVQITGGGFRLHPFKTFGDGSYAPQIWAEITQR